MADQQALIAEFCGVSGSTAAQAQFFLESTKWDLTHALSQFFDSDSAAVSQSQSVSVSQPTTSSLSGPPASMGLGMGLGMPVPPSTSASSSASAVPKQRTNIASFKDLLSQGSGDEDSDDGPDLFSGGEKSSLAMKGGPGKKNKAPNDIVKNILEQAAKSGPAGPEFDTAAPESPTFFTGSGHTLGTDTSAPSQQVVGAPAASPSALPTAVDRHLTFWSNGFSIDDGELMSYEDPSAQEFLKAVQNGRAPTHMLNVGSGQPVNLKVAHRMKEEYKAPPKAAQSFGGEGRRLGAIVPGSSSLAMPGAFPVSSSTDPAPAPALASAAFRLQIDDSKPKTQVQIRLGDGTRMISQFNTTHTVRDIRSFINASRPGESTRNYQLVMTFPNKALTDETLTIEEAGMKGAVVCQKYV